MAAIIDSGRVLAYMAIYRFSFLLLLAGDLNIIGGSENHGLLTGAYFKKVKSEFLLCPDPCLNRKQAGYLVVLVGIYRPVGENDVRLFFLDEPTPVFHPFVIDHGISVHLTREYGFYL